MKIIKDGRIIDVWIGKCGECGAVMEAKKEELEEITGNVSGQGEYVSSCKYCDHPTVLFDRVNTPYAKGILRKDGLKTLYKSTKKSTDNGIYSSGKK